MTSQIGYQLGIDSIDGITMPNGAELMPIATLKQIMFFYGLDAPNLGAFAGEKQWANRATDFPGTEGASVIEIHTDLDEGNKLIATLQGVQTGDKDVSGA